MTTAGGIDVDSDARDDETSRERNRQFGASISSLISGSYVNIEVSGESRSEVV